MELTGSVEREGQSKLDDDDEEQQNEEMELTGNARSGKARPSSTTTKSKMKKMMKK
jgi:hypothetical protein